jgi:hypothetical protein
VQATHSDVLGLRTSSAKLSTLILFCISRNSGVRSPETPLQQQKSAVVDFTGCLSLAFHPDGYVIFAELLHATLTAPKQAIPGSLGADFLINGLQGAPGLDVR